MVHMFNLPAYKQISYQFSPMTGYYTKTDAQPEKEAVMVLPYELKREITRADQIKGNAGECLTKRDYKKDNGSRKLLTGLQPTQLKNWYTGDHVRYSKGEKINSLLLIHFSDDNRLMTIFYFPGYFKPSQLERQKFAMYMIPQLTNVRTF